MLNVEGGAGDLLAGGGGFFGGVEVVGEDQDGAAEAAEAVVVELSVVAGVVDYAEFADPHGGRAAAVEVHRVGAAEGLHEAGEFFESHAVSEAGVAAVDGDEKDAAFRGDADGRAGMAVADVENFAGGEAFVN